jgi:type IV secretory pathway VirB10-like protein
MGPRAGLSTVLIVGALILLVAIVIGQNMGNHVLGQIADRGPAISETPIPTPSPSPDDDVAGGSLSTQWKHRQVISVATDPAFPDPRVTPEPTPPPTPVPTRRPTPQPTPQNDTPAPDDTGVDQPQSTTYTSPPLPMPLVSHAPDETAPDEGGSPPASASPPGRNQGAGPRPTFTGRGYPTLPPYSGGTPIP